jgi:hypothetical protein
MFFPRLLNPGYPLLNETLLVMLLFKKEEEYKRFLEKNFPDEADKIIQEMEISEFNYV